MTISSVLRCSRSGCAGIWFGKSRCCRASQLSSIREHGTQTEAGVSGPVAICFASTCWR